MTNEEAIKYLKQLYPNSGHCWLDEQRIEAIGMAVKALQEEPAPKMFEDMLNAKTSAESLGISQEEHDRIVDECIYGKEPELVDTDDLPKEEPASEIDFEQELYKAFGQVKDFTLGMQIAKRFYEMGKNNQEPVSEDLEEASKEWLRPQLDKSYANYGETKMMELTRFDGYAMLDAIEYGMKLQKKKMIKDAYEREVKVDAGGYPYIPQMELYDYDKDVPLAKEGDRVKVVVIKED